MSKKQEAIDLIASRVRAAGEIGSFSLSLTLVEAAHVLEALRERSDTAS